jgi:quercetin dioxygenase-like cupin family protein
VIREWTLPAHPGDQAPPHVHHRGDEAFCVLDGALEVLVGNERRRLGPGEWVTIHAGTVHTFANPGPGETRMLVVMTPEIDALIGALHAAESNQAREAVWARHNSSVAALS